MFLQNEMQILCRDLLIRLIWFLFFLHYSECSMFILTWTWFKIIETHSVFRNIKHMPTFKKTTVNVDEFFEVIAFSIAVCQANGTLNWDSFWMSNIVSSEQHETAWGPLFEKKTEKPRPELDRMPNSWRDSPVVKLDNSTCHSTLHSPGDAISNLTIDNRRP